MEKSGPKIIRYFLFVGFIVPWLLFAMISLADITVGGIWTWIVLIPWPAFPLIMAAEGGHGAFGVLPALTVSALGNVLVYGLVGSIVSFCYRRFFGPF